jgi:hypothetical protein
LLFEFGENDNFTEVNKKESLINKSQLPYQTILASSRAGINLKIIKRTS